MNTTTPILTFPDDYGLVRPADDIYSTDRRLGRFFLLDERPALCYARQPRVGHWMSFLDDPTCCVIATREDFARSIKSVGPIMYRSAPAHACQSTLSYLRLHNIYRPEDAWKVWREVTCELIFSRHGPQWGSDEEKIRFAEENLRDYFEVGASPAKARRSWWRQHTTGRPVSLHGLTDLSTFDGENFSNLYDNVLIRHVGMLRRHLGRIETKRPGTYNEQVQAMRTRLGKMEVELQRRGLET